MPLAFTQEDFLVIIYCGSDCDKLSREQFFFNKNCETRHIIYVIFSRVCCRKIYPCIIHIQLHN